MTRRSIDDQGNRGFHRGRRVSLLGSTPGKTSVERCEWVPRNQGIGSARSGSFPSGGDIRRGCHSGSRAIDGLFRRLRRFSGSPMADDVRVNGDHQNPQHGIRPKHKRHRSKDDPNDHQRTMQQLSIVKGFPDPSVHGEILVNVSRRFHLSRANLGSIRSGSTYTRTGRCFRRFRRRFAAAFREGGFAPLGWMTR